MPGTDDIGAQLKIERQPCPAFPPLWNVCPAFLPFGRCTAHNRSGFARTFALVYTARIMPAPGIRLSIAAGSVAEHIVLPSPSSMRRMELVE